MPTIEEQRAARERMWDEKQARQDALDMFERQRDLAERIIIAMAQGGAMATGVAPAMTAKDVAERGWALAVALDRANEARRPKPEGSGS